MKKLLTSAALAVLFFSASPSVSAFSNDPVEPVCKKPQFKDFSLPEYHKSNKTEVAPESNIRFTISHEIEPTSIKLLLKKQPLTFTLTDKNSFYLVEAKIPATYTGQFLRVDVMATALLGCRGADGWLIKVAGNAPATDAAPATEVTPESGNATATPATK